MRIRVPVEIDKVLDPLEHAGQLGRRLLRCKEGFCREGLVLRRLATILMGGCGCCRFSCHRCCQSVLRSNELSTVTGDRTRTLAGKARQSLTLELMRRMGAIQGRPERMLGGACMYIDGRS